MRKVSFLLLKQSSKDVNNNNNQVVVCSELRLDSTKKQIFQSQKIMFSKTHT